MYDECNVRVLRWFIISAPRGALSVYCNGVLLIAVTNLVHGTYILNTFKAIRVQTFACLLSITLFVKRGLDSSGSLHSGSTVLSYK